MRKNNRRYSQPIEEPPINITPLIDVVFVILIMFIVVAPLLDMDNIELAGGNADKSVETAIQDNNPITIRVYPDNSIRFNDNKVFLPQLTALLAKAKKSHPGAHPQVLHDKRAHFGTYQAVKNAVESAGFEEMDIVLAPG
jgi:biopolymer transport protein ExbD